MNKNKEKKISAIKAEILEVKKFASSQNFKNTENKILNDEKSSDFKNTITLTNIVDTETEKWPNDDLSTIKKDLNSLKFTLNEHEKLLKNILLKLK